MEELVLTDPVTEPAKTTAKFHVIALTMQHETIAIPGGKPGLVVVDVQDNLGVVRSQQYTGDVAIDYIKFVNTANFSTKSLNKRILERLSAEGVLPGTVVGTPDP